MSINNQEISKNTVIGIIGGAGPEACIDFQLKLFNLIHTKKNILSDRDHIRVIADNNTDLVNRDQHFFSDNNILQKQLLQSLRLLETAGVSIAAIICNSAHIYFDQIQSSTSIKLINILYTVGNYLKENGIKRIGLLCTLSMYRSEVYKQVLENYGVTVVIPDRKNQIRLSQIIYLIKAGLCGVRKDMLSKNDKLLDVYRHNLMPLITEIEYHNLELISPQKLFKLVIQDLENMDKVDCFVLGCTELPLVTDWYKSFSSKFIDPNFLLADELLKNALLQNAQKNLCYYK